MPSLHLDPNRLNRVWISLSNFYYHILPAWFRKNVGPVLEGLLKFFHRLYRIVDDLYPRVVKARFHGTANDPRQYLLMANGGEATEYFISRFPVEKLRNTIQRRIPIEALGPGFEADVNMILVEGDRFYANWMEKREMIAVPEWVRFKMDLSRPMPEIVENWKKRGGEENLRKIRKYRFACEETQSPDRLDEFYQQMYLPHLRGRIGNLAHVASLGHMRGLLESGTLLLLKDQAVDLAGMLISARGPTPVAAFIAVRHANREYLRQGAMSALYYHGMVWAQSQGYRLMDFGHCRPILSDGLFRYKRKWGMRVEKSDEKHRMLFLWCGKLDSAGQKCLEATPLVCEHQGKLQGLIFYRSDRTPTANSIIELTEKYHIPGLQGLRFIALGAQSPDVFQGMTANPHPKGLLS